MAIKNGAIVSVTETSAMSLIRIGGPIDDYDAQWILQ